MTRIPYCIITLPEARAFYAALPSQQTRANLVYQTIKSFANPDGSRCWPGLKAIAERAQLSVRTVKRAIKCLKDSGVLEVRRRGGNRPNVYGFPLLAGPRGQVEQPAAHDDSKALRNSMPTVSELKASDRRAQLINAEKRTYGNEAAREGQIGTVAVGPSHGARGQEPETPTEAIETPRRSLIRLPAPGPSGGASEQGPQAPTNAIWPQVNKMIALDGKLWDDEQKDRGITNLVGDWKHSWQECADNAAKAAKPEPPPFDDVVTAMADRVKEAYPKKGNSIRIALRGMVFGNSFNGGPRKELIHMWNHMLAYDFDLERFATYEPIFSKTKYVKDYLGDEDDENGSGAESAIPTSESTPRAAPPLVPVVVRVRHVVSPAALRKRKGEKNATAERKTVRPRRP